MGTGDGDDPSPRSPAIRGWRRGWTPDPWQIGIGTAIPDPRQIGDGGGDGDRGFRALAENRNETQRHGCWRLYEASCRATRTMVPPAISGSDSSRGVYLPLALLIAYASSIWNGIANGWFMEPTVKEGQIDLFESS
jgi:hypothetical protein